MKKFLLGISLATALLIQSPAQAIVGVSTGNSVVAAVGAGVTLFSIFGQMEAQKDFRMYTNFTYMLRLGNFLINPWLVSGLGLILLDKNSAEINYATIDSATGKALGLTAQEINSYNSEVPRLNLIQQEISEELAKLDAQAASKQAKALWQTRIEAGEISSATISAAQKLSQ